MSGRDIPVLFSAPMVRANLRDVDPKTMTRRLLYVPQKTRPTAKFDPDHKAPLTQPGPGLSWTLSNWSKAEPGDRIWQRETWAPQTDCESSAKRWTIDWPIQHGPRPIVHFGADENVRAWVSKWRPNIHMPRWACRFEALIKAVRIERLQDISDEDAIAEGIERGVGFPGWYRGPLKGDGAGLQEAGRTFRIPTAFPRLAYRALWESINGPDSWDANPWVCVITYERIEL